MKTDMPSGVLRTSVRAACYPWASISSSDPYYEHENNTREGPDQQVKAGGLILNLDYQIEAAGAS